MIKKTHIILLGWIILFWSFLAISPINRHDWAMENILFILFFATLVVTYKKFTFSNISYILITSFLTLHLIGAHYTYSEVPFGFWLSDLFDLKRNHFDRIVHFSFGLLLTYPVAELWVRNTKLDGPINLISPIVIIFALSSFFEIIEWLFVLAVNPELGGAYLGMQGDVWDAQKDMVLALIGAIISTIIPTKLSQPS